MFPDSLPYLHTYQYSKEKNIRLFGIFYPGILVVSITIYLYYANNKKQYKADSTDAPDQQSTDNDVHEEAAPSAFDEEYKLLCPYCHITLLQSDVICPACRNAIKK